MRERKGGNEGEREQAGDFYRPTDNEREEQWEREKSRTMAGDNEEVARRWNNGKLVRQWKGEDRIAKLTKQWRRQ